MTVDDWVGVVDAAIQLIGEDHVSLGSDWDGGRRYRSARAISGICQCLQMPSDAVDIRSSASLNSRRKPSARFSAYYGETWSAGVKLSGYASPSAPLRVSLSGARRKRIATVITEYRLNSHADVIVGRLLEGYDYYGKRRAPRVEVVSMYTDQVPANDLSRPMAAKHGVRIYPTVHDALTLGTDRLAVDGVVFIGEHGNYPLNEKGQQLYPRYELFKQIVEVFRASGRAVPVYSDKHLSVEWDKAKWMYDQARELGFPLMAGSSKPVSWRKPPLELELETPVSQSVAFYYGPKEAYGFHALEVNQCMVERREGGETGIAAVQCLEGPAVWEWTAKTDWATPLLEAALARSETRKPGKVAELTQKPLAFVLQYRSELESAVYLLNGCVEDSAFAARVRGKPEPVSTEFWAQRGRPFSHFCGLVHYIEELMVTGRAPYPVERTLLNTGVLAALMDSSYQKNRRIETPQLSVAYRAPAKSLFNRGAVPPLEEAASRKSNS